MSEEFVERLQISLCIDTSRVSPAALVMVTKLLLSIIFVVTPSVRSLVEWVHFISARRVNETLLMAAGNRGAAIFSVTGA